MHDPMAVQPPERAVAAVALYASVLACNSLDAAAHTLVTTLALDGGFDRASIGLHTDGRTRLLASTHLGPADMPQEQLECVLGAMDEALEQGVSLAWPAADASAPGSGDNPIRIEQQVLQRLVGGAVATVPLGFAGVAFAAVCVERHGGPPVSAAELAVLEQLLVLAAPALRWMQHGSQPWHQRAGRAFAQSVDRLRQPSQHTRRRLLLVAALAVLFGAVVPLERTVGGRARVEGAQQRVLSAPTDGFIKASHARPGDRVLAGAALVDLVEEDLQLERDRWSSQLAQHENAYAAAMAKSDRVAASTSFARVAEAQAQLALVDAQRSRSRITAPFDAVVVQGDLSQTIGAPVRQGDPLMTLATTDAYRVIVEIDEVDIARVRPGQAGHLAVSSLPWHQQDLQVVRITPLSKAVEGRNVFEVEAQLVQGKESLRPGLIGRAELVVGRLPPLWAWSLHAVERIRLAWWSWIG